MNLTLPSSTELVVISDVHLRAENDHRINLLCEAISISIESRVPYLVLLGDIFDFCFGSQLYFQSKFAKVKLAVEKANGSGTKIIFFEGNHELDLEGLGWSGVDFVPDGSRVLSMPSGAKIKFAHGDMIYSNRRYKFFRWVVKSRFISWLGKLIPGKFLDAIALTNASASRAADTYRELNHAKIVGAANKWLKGDEADHGIFGHFHVPYAEKRADRNGKLLSVDSWDKPNILTFSKSDDFKRYFYNGNAWILALPTPVLGT